MKSDPTTTATTTARGKPFQRNHHAISLLWIADALCCTPTPSAIESAALDQWGFTCEIDEAGDVIINGTIVINPHDFAGGDGNVLLIQPAFTHAVRAAVLQELVYWPALADTTA